MPYEKRSFESLVEACGEDWIAATCNKVLKAERAKYLRFQITRDLQHLGTIAMQKNMTVADGNTMDVLRLRIAEHQKELREL